MHLLEAGAELIRWFYSHVQHLLGYPSVAILARYLTKYETERIKRRETMNVPVISQLITLIEEIFKAHGQQVATAAGEAAATAAIATAETDPKVMAVTEASLALLAAAQNMKAVIDAHPEAAAVAPVAQPEAPKA